MAAKPPGTDQPAFHFLLVFGKGGGVLTTQGRFLGLFKTTEEFEMG